MPSRSRRAFLATLGTLSVTGCAGFSVFDGASPPAKRPLENRTVYTDGQVTVPGAKDVRPDQLEGTDVAVVSAESTSHDTLLAAMSKGIPAAIVGTNAPVYAISACEASGRPYALPSRAWSGEAKFSALVPTDHGIDVQRFLHTTVPDDLPQALGELLDGRPRTPAITLETRDAGTPLGRVRIRGRDDYGGFDRWDSAHRLADGRIAVTTTATIERSRRTDPEPGFVPDRIRIVKEFDAAVRAAAPSKTTEGGVAVTDVKRSDHNTVTYVFEPRSSDAKTIFTARTRTVIDSGTSDGSVSYLADVRFNWRNRGLLKDRTALQATSGQPTWQTTTASH